MKQLDYFVVLTNGEVSFESSLENPEMVPQISVPGYIAFAERLRFFSKLPVNQHIKDIKIRGPILFRKMGKETPIEDKPQPRVTFHFDRVVYQPPPSATGFIQPLPFFFKRP